VTDSTETAAGWTPHVDGFVKGNIGVFPYFFGSWTVWDNFSGEWQESEPFTCASMEGVDVDLNRDPRYLYWTRSKEETIADAKRLAEEWLLIRP
jgi:hypothetical protein